MNCGAYIIMNLPCYNFVNIMKFVYSFLILLNSFGDQATKRHLTQRIENLDGKLDEQKEISKLIKNEVHPKIYLPYCIMP